MVGTLYGKMEEGLGRGEEAVGENKKKVKSRGEEGKWIIQICYGKKCSEERKAQNE